MYVVIPQVQSYENTRNHGSGAIFIKCRWYVFGLKVPNITNLLGFEVQY